jgi:hypothetical protein
MRPDGPTNPAPMTMIAAHAGNARLVGETRRKDDRLVRKRWSSRPAPAQRNRITSRLRHSLLSPGRFVPVAVHDVGESESASGGKHRIDARRSKLRLQRRKTQQLDLLET